MTGSLSTRDFATFFEAIYGHGPFPWQSMLLERIEARGWPDLLDLPTASGKTSCIDIAVFAMALGIGRTPRRLWFVVDRRIVVDEAHSRARRLADALGAPANPIVAAVAERLRQLSGGNIPLLTARLRGGVAADPQDKAWLSDPTQPAVITATVDQVGSRLLFRSYGCSDLVAPIHAALAAYDSLIILDEAHCSEPFRQTATEVSRQAASCAAIAVPALRLLTMTATPPPGPNDRFPSDESEWARAMDHEKLHQRRVAQKLAKLEQVRGAQFVSTAVTRALEFAAKHGRRRIAVMVNRVRTAQEIARAARDASGESAEVVLMTGRMRPIDRDQLVKTFEPYLRSGSEQSRERPVIVVTTQCLEVGADFSFDALVTECASLSALLQRFGRVDRLGIIGCTNSLVLARNDDVKEGADDILYGTAIAATWKWLGGAGAEADFGIDAMRARLQPLTETQRGELRGVQVSAPILTDAHIDLLCQTAPRPSPEPQIEYYLHGMGRGEPQARVAWRADLTWDPQRSESDNRQAWEDLLDLSPPVSLECLAVSLDKLRRYLGGERLLDPTNDLEGEPASDVDPEVAVLPTSPFAMRRNGKILVSKNARDIRPNDTVILTEASALAELGTPLDGAPMDRADQAQLIAGRRVTLRIHPIVLAEFATNPEVAALLDLARRTVDEEEPDVDRIQEILRGIGGRASADAETPSPLPEWLTEIARRLAKKCDLRRWLERHPIARDSWIISIPMAQLAAADDAGEDERLISQGRKEDRSLDAHTRAVVGAARRFAGLLPADLWEPVLVAARSHDAGKLDPRFQAILNGGHPADTPLAKSQRKIPQAQWERLQCVLELPPGFRHEMLSMQLLERIGRDLPDSPRERDLILHLIAAHHGHARPFAPWVPDPAPPDVRGRLLDRDLVLIDRQPHNLPPPHRLDSGIPDRFWRLTRHFGWWGLAYLETILRLADWYGSAHPNTGEQPDEEETA